MDVLEIAARFPGNAPKGHFSAKAGPWDFALNAYELALTIALNPTSIEMRCPSRRGVAVRRDTVGIRASNAILKGDGDGFKWSAGRCLAALSFRRTPAWL